MSEYFSEPKSLGKVKIVLDLPNRAKKKKKKTDLKNATGIDASSFLKRLT